MTFYITHLALPLLLRGDAGDPKTGDMEPAAAVAIAVQQVPAAHGPTLVTDRTKVAVPVPCPLPVGTGSPTGSGTASASLHGGATGFRLRLGLGV